MVEINNCLYDHSNDRENIEHADGNTEIVTFVRTKHKAHTEFQCEESYAGNVTYVHKRVPRVDVICCHKQCEKDECSGDGHINLQNLKYTCIAIKLHHMLCSINFDKKVE